MAVKPLKTYKVWIIIEEWDHEAEEGSELDAPGSALCELRSYEEAFQFADKLDAIAHAMLDATEQQPGGQMPADAGDWRVESTPCWPNAYKVVNDRVQPDNSIRNYFPSAALAQAEANRRNQQTANSKD
jgi:hypothetical protein